jgi:hypothetical protein
MSKSKKKGNFGYIVKLVLFGIIITCFFSFFIDILLFFSKETTCATVTEETTVNNNIWVYKYSYQVEGVTYDSSKPTIKFKKNITTDNLKDLNCVEVSYFPLVPYFGTITDKRVIR